MLSVSSQQVVKIEANDLLEVSPQLLSEGRGGREVTYYNGLLQIYNYLSP